MQTTNNTKQIFFNKEEFIDELAFNFMQYFNIRSPKESIERAEGHPPLFQYFFILDCWLIGIEPAHTIPSQ